jgi:hypothetical protein
MPILIASHSHNNDRMNANILPALHRPSPGFLWFGKGGKRGGFWDNVAKKLKKNLAILKKNLAISKKSRAISKKTCAVSKKTCAISKKSRTISKKTCAISKKSRAILKKTCAISKKNLAILKKSRARLFQNREIFFALYRKIEYTL